MNERDLRKLYESTGGDAADYDSWKRSNKNIIQRLSNQNNSGGSDGSSGSGSDTTGGRRFGDALMDGITKILQGGLRQTSAPQGPNYLEQTLSSVFKQQKGGNLFEKMGTVLADLGTNAVADYAAEQSYLLTEVNEKLGLTGTLSEEFREEITKAQPALIRMGVPFDELVDSAKELVDTTGRFALVGSDMLVRAGEIAQAYGMDMTEIVGSYAEFERVGIGAAEAQESIADAGERSLELGLQSKTTIKGLMDNIGTLNQYGFQNGVEGLEKMVRRSTEIRMELSNVFKVAENVFDPEGALDLSANLQVLGAAFGDFNDPLRLMYMATNEVEGLQGALEGVSKNLATYNTIFRARKGQAFPTENLTFLWQGQYDGNDLLNSLDESDLENVNNTLKAGIKNISGQLADGLKDRENLAKDVVDGISDLTYKRFKKEIDTYGYYTVLKNGKRTKYYLENGSLPKDWHDDITYISRDNKELTGYATQKPKALIERLVKASTNEGDLVADFYGGSFTTAEVCKDLNRNFIGCDMTSEVFETCKLIMKVMGILLEL